MHANVKDLTGQRFGRLVVVRQTGRYPNHRAEWECTCDCGSTVLTIGQHLKRGATVSCGCSRFENAHRTHGKSKTPTHRAWLRMLDRCRNPSLPGWKNWGGRGIKVCDRWHDFKNFLADMGEMPRGMSIDRIDNNGNYEPGNCRWATAKQQVRNSRKTKLSEQDVREIRGRLDYGEPHWSIARRFGITGNQVGNIMHRRSWSDID